MLLGEDFLVDIVSQPHVEQPILLLDDEGLLPSQFSPLSTRISLGIASLRGQHHAEPVADGGIVDLHLVKDRQHLGFDVGLFHSNARVVALGVAGTAVIDVLVDTAILPLLPDQLSGDRMAAMPAGHELTGIGQRRGMVRTSTKERLHPIPGRPVDQRLMLAGIPLPLVLDFADVTPVFEDVVD